MPSKTYTENHKEELKEYYRNYYIKNKAKYKEYTKQYSINHKEEIKKKREPRIESMKEYAKNWHSKQREEFLRMYGNKCSCCGETITEFLTIEHIEGQTGKKSEVSHKAYRIAIKEYRPDIYEILCYNCNCSKGRYGKCPHKSLKND